MDVPQRAVRRDGDAAVRSRPRPRYHGASRRRANAPGERTRAARCACRARAPCAGADSSSSSRRTNGSRVEIAERERAEDHRERTLIEQRDTLAFLATVSEALAPVVRLGELLEVMRTLPVPFAADWTMIYVPADGRRSFARKLESISTRQRAPQLAGMAEALHPLMARWLAGRARNGHRPGDVRQRCETCGLATRVAGGGESSSAAASARDRQRGDRAAPRAGPNSSRPCCWAPRQPAAMPTRAGS